MRVRASAGASSFRRRKTLEEHLAETQKQVEQLKSHREAPTAPPSNRGQKAAQRRAAEDRVRKTEAALEALATVAKIRQDAKGGKNSRSEPRASTPDSEARVMKVPDGHRPGQDNI
jgi:hypothetical protein